MQLNTPDARNMSTGARANMQILRARVSVWMRMHTRGVAGYLARCSSSMALRQQTHTSLMRTFVLVCACGRAFAWTVLVVGAHHEHTRARQRAEPAHACWCMHKKARARSGELSRTLMSTRKRRLAELAHACGCMRKKARASCSELSRSLMSTRTPTCRAHARVEVYA